MLSTYYIYYIVTTYYVINGINIIEYLHTDIVEIKGVCQYIATLYPLEIYKRGMTTVTLHTNSKLYVMALHGIGMGFGLVTLTLSRSTLSRSLIGFEGAEVRAPFTFPPKKNMCFLVC